jgi:ABC-type polysaccharide/polyol phosphate transport system ATPase subunit
LRDVSFDVHEGEFFGIVGRNGSGKSTLLKILASIYGKTGGRIRMAGRLAPFIELGVGFDPELTAHENVVLNGVMMGLGRREAQRRLDAVLDFADLGEFAELKLKNYSSGMMVRLAFSVMVQADADIMLIDEVLAVGDAAFAQKCMDVFYEKRRAGKTIVLVTHDMSTVQSICHRAMLLHDGELRYTGEPEEAAMRYFRLNFGGPGRLRGPEPTVVPDVNARLVDAWLEDADGGRAENVELGEPIRLNLVVEAMQELTEPVFGFLFLTSTGAQVFGFTLPVDGDGVQPGQRIRVQGVVENSLTPGRYFVNCWLTSRLGKDLGLQPMRPLDFVVYGTGTGTGLGVVNVRTDLEARVEP